MSYVTARVKGIYLCPILFCGLYLSACTEVKSDSQLFNYPSCSGSTITAYDRQGNPWGWENNQSCRISQGATSNNNGGDFANCQGNKVTAYDQQGNPWGWENNKSCRIVTNNDNNNNVENNNSNNEPSRFIVTRQVENVSVSFYADRETPYAECPQAGVAITLGGEILIADNQLRTAGGDFSFNFLQVNDLNRGAAEICRYTPNGRQQLEAGNGGCTCLRRI